MQHLFTTKVTIHVPHLKSSQKFCEQMELALPERKSDVPNVDELNLRLLSSLVQLQDKVIK